VPFTKTRAVAARDNDIDLRGRAGLEAARLERHRNAGATLLVETLLFSLLGRKRLDDPSGCDGLLHHRC